MTQLRPAANADAAQWLLASAADWWDLVRYGPPGFEVYVRIAFTDGAEGAEVTGEEPGVRAALATLARYTAAPASAYAAIWEGWNGDGQIPDAPRVDIPLSDGCATGNQHRCTATAPSTSSRAHRPLHAGTGD